MDEFRNILQLDLFGIVFCNIGHDAADAAVIFFILSGRGGSLGQCVGAQKLPEVLQSGNDLKFIHRFSLAVKGNDLPDIFHGILMPFHGKIQRNCRERKLRRIGSVYFWKRILPGKP